MNRRTALAAAAAVSLSITGLAAAAGATMHVFDAAEASPNVGKVSPVSIPTRPPVVERHVVVVDDPAPVAPAPELRAPGESHRVAGSRPADGAPRPAAPTAAPAPSPAPSAPPATHAPEPEFGHEFGDD